MSESSPVESAASPTAADDLWGVDAQAGAAVPAAVDLKAVEKAEAEARCHSVEKMVEWLVGLGPSAVMNTVERRQLSTRMRENGIKDAMDQYREMVLVELLRMKAAGGGKLKGWKEWDLGGLTYRAVAEKWPLIAKAALSKRPSGAQKRKRREYRKVLEKAGEEAAAEKKKAGDREGGEGGEVGKTSAAPVTADKADAPDAEGDPGTAVDQAVPANADWVRDVLWVYHNISNTRAKPSDAPCPGAFELLVHVRKNDRTREKFYEGLLQRAMAAQAQRERAAADKAATEAGAGRAGGGDMGHDEILRLLREVG